MPRGGLSWGAGGCGLRRQAAERLEQTHAPVEAIHHVRRFIGVNFRSAHSACRGVRQLSRCAEDLSEPAAARLWAPLRWHQPTDEARDNRMAQRRISSYVLRYAAGRSHPRLKIIQTWQSRALTDRMPGEMLRVVMTGRLH